MANIIFKNIRWQNYIDKDNQMRNYRGGRELKTKCKDFLL